MPSSAFRRLPAVVCLAIALVTLPARAQRILTNPTTEELSQVTIQFDTFDLVDNGSGGVTVVASGMFDDFFSDDVDDSPVRFVYRFDAPANLANAVTPTQISANFFSVGDYGVEEFPVVSPNGLHVLASHSRGTGGADPTIDTLHTIPIAGEFSATAHTGLFSGTTGTNTVGPGANNSSPIFNSTGSEIFFINFDAGNDGNDVIYRAGFNQTTGVTSGAPTAVTPVTDDINRGLFDVTSDNSAVVYAPGPDGTELVSVDIASEVRSVIPITAGPNPDFDIDNRLTVSADGSAVLFIGDYDVLDQNELYSVPITGGTPTRVSDALPAGGDVTNFAISPDGLSVAYAAGQNDAATNEVFFKSLAGASGSSVQISPTLAPGKGGTFDVATDGDQGVLRFSPDGTQVFYVGDQDTNGVRDLYVVDTTEKTASPIDSVYTYSGVDGGDFYTETNYQNSLGNSPVAEALPFSGEAEDIEITVVIDGPTTVVSNEDIDFGENGSGGLILTGGATLQVNGSANDLDIDDDATIEVTDSRIETGDNFFTNGVTTLTNATIVAGDDVEFRGENTITINGGLFTANESGGAIEIRGWTDDSSITGARFEGLRLSVESLESDDEGTPATVSATDSVFVIAGEANDAQGSDAGSLTLLGSSTFEAETFDEGFDLLLDDQSTATLVGDAAGEFSENYLGGLGGDDVGSSITLLSTDAEVTLPAYVPDPADPIDPREFLFNGLTGDSYLTDPSAWNITDWDGLSAVTLSLVEQILLGDFNNDGIVDAADYTTWRDNFGGSESALNGNSNGDGVVDGLDYDDWVANFGTTLLPTTGVSVPEPAGLVALLGLCLPGLFRRSR